MADKLIVDHPEMQALFEQAGTTVEPTGNRMAVSNWPAPRWSGNLDLNEEWEAYKREHPEACGNSAGQH